MPALISARTLKMIFVSFSSKRLGFGIWTYIIININAWGRKSEFEILTASSSIN